MGFKGGGSRFSGGSSFSSSSFRSSGGGFRGSGSRYGGGHSHHHHHSHRGYYGPSFRFYSPHWFGPSPSWYWSPSSCGCCCCLIFAMVVLVIVGMVASSYSDKDRLLVVIPKSTLLLDNIDTSRVQKAAFNIPSGTYDGKAYKCSQIPPYNPGYVSTQLSQGITAAPYDYLYYQLNLNEGSSINYQFATDRHIDFYLLAGQSTFNNWKNNPYSYNPSCSYCKSLNDGFTATKSDSFYWIFENIYDDFWSAKGTVNFDVSLKTFNVFDSVCELQCDFSTASYCEVPITRYSSEVVILTGVTAGNWVNEVDHKYTTYPSEYGKPLLLFATFGLIVTSFSMCIAACVGKRGSESTQPLIQPVPQPTTVIVNQQAPPVVYTQAQPAYQPQPQQYVPQQQYQGQYQQQAPQYQPEAPPMYTYNQQ
ncbi:hypothetical protein RCL1_008420 [Eukaryota sp. TZLM3-RCL]